MDESILKEVVLMEDYRLECPYCHSDVSELIKTSENYETTDVENVEDDKYGVQSRWKQIYVCPHCGDKFYELCEH